jgi:formylglycine-generating enzyme required for sulfatase activity
MRGRCEFEDASCPANALAICRNGHVLPCESGKLSTYGENCSERGIECQSVSNDDGQPTAVCAVSGTRCAESEGVECFEDSVVACSDGFPTARLATCDTPRERCVTLETMPRTAACALDAECPANDRTLCELGSVYGCVDSPAPTRLEDCAAWLEHCRLVGEQALCTQSTDGPRPMEWQQVPGGSFVPGPRGTSAPTMTLGTFELTRREVTVGHYELCRAAGACGPPKSADVDCIPWQNRFRGDAPIVCIDAPSAAACCAWSGGRLPSELEWEYALRNGGADVEFPWGDEPFSETPSVPWGWLSIRTGCERSVDVTEHGVCDLVGNVKEWVVSSTGGVVVRGASFSEEPESLRLPGETQARQFASPEVGFRCAR